MNIHASGTRLVPPPDSAHVDERAATELVTRARAVAESITAPMLGGGERLTRARLAADGARDVADALPLLNVYADRRHARLLDLSATDRRRRGPIDRAEAADRLAADRQFYAVTRDLRAIAWVDSPRTGHLTPASTAPAAQVGSPLLDRLAVPATAPLGPGRWVTGAWTGLPAAIIDPAAGDQVSGNGAPTLPGGKRDWHLSAYALDLADQVPDWSVNGARDVEAVLALIVNTGLERAILTDLATGAPTSPDIAAAEALVAAVWPLGADIVVANPVDVPKVRATYAAAGQWPAPLEIIASAGATPGTALVLGSGAVSIEASDVEWMVQTRPALMGQDVAALRYGMGTLRVLGGVVTVNLTTP